MTTNTKEVNPYLERDKAMRDDLIVTMLAMLQDLIEHEVSRSQP